jgi:hypothetical protein
LGVDRDGAARLELLRRQAPYAQTFVADPDYTMLPVMARN